MSRVNLVLFSVLHEVLTLDISTAVALTVARRKRKGKKENKKVEIKLPDILF